jgi:hypothetical protein
MNVAIIENNLVVNLIIAESLDLASTLTNLEVLDADLLGIMVGSLRVDGKWYPPKPYENWVWHELAEKWMDPEEVEAEANGEITILTAAQEKELIDRIRPIVKELGIEI